MPLIDKAWKANVNVWKRHLTLQSVFNHGECMTHVDKNADGHVVDQNVDQISREIAYVRLGGGLGPNVVHACIFFFFWMSTRYAYLEDDGSWFMFSEDQGFFVWLMFLEDQRFWILAHVFRGLGFLDLGSCFQSTKGFVGFGSCFQRTKGSGSWLMFSET